MKDIVAEAARQCADAPRKNTKFAEEDFKPIIQSAVEKWQAYYETEILQLHIVDRTAQTSEPWHPCEHCKQFDKSVKILDANSYAVGEAKDWDAAVAISNAHNATLQPAQASEKLVQAAEKGWDELAGALAERKPDEG